MAALKKPAKKKDGGKPSTVLIVFLVFFILISILLGVTAYYGYEGQNKLKEEAANARNSVKAAKILDDYRMGAIQFLLQAVGEKVDNEEEIRANTALENILKEPSIFNEKDRKALVDLYKSMEKDLGVAGGKFKDNYRSLAKQAADDLKKAEAQFAATDLKLKDLDKESRAYQAKVEAFDKANSTRIKDYNDKILVAANTQSGAVVNLLKQIKDLQDQKLDVENKARESEEKLKIEISRVNKMLEEKKNFNIEVVAPKRTGDQHALFLDVSRGIPFWDKYVGKITRVDLDKRLVFIDLGSEHGVRPELTFSVFADDGKGQADRFLKGTIEVVRVIDAGTSLCRITSLYDASGVEIALNDPTRGRASREVESAMREKDLIFNMFWNTRVAVAGIVNFNHVAADSPAEQMRQLASFGQVLERENIHLDAYLDLSDGQVKGAISNKTRFLILGNLAYPKNPADEGQKERAKAINEVISAMKKEAIDKGMLLISAENFMLAAGYRQPRNALDNAVSGFRASVPFAGSSATGLVIQRERQGAEAAPMMEKKEPEAKEKDEKEK